MKKKELSYQKIARIIGAIYLIVIACGIFSEAFVRTELVVYSDPSLTTKNIVKSESLFRLGIVSDIIVLFGDITISILLYVIFKSFNAIIALLATAFRLIVVAVSAVNVFNMISVLLLVNGADYLNSFNTEQLESVVLFLFKSHSYGYDIVLAFFSIHCALLGLLFAKSQLVPKELSVAFIITAICYFTFSFGRFLFPQFAKSLYPLVLLPPLISELALALWLLFKGINTSKLKIIK